MTKIIRTSYIDKDDIETLTIKRGEINIIEYSKCKDCGKDLKIETHLVFKEVQ